MPDKNDTTLAVRETNMLEQFSDQLVRMYGSGKPLHPMIDDVGSSLREMCLAFKSAGVLLGGQDSKASKEQITDAAHNLQQKQADFIKAMKTAVQSKELKKQEPDGFGLLTEIADTFVNTHTVIERRQQAVNTMAQIMSFQAQAETLKEQGKTAELQQATRAYDFQSLRPSFEECARPKTAQDPEKTFRQMLWLSEHCSKTEYGENGSFYQKTLDKMRQEIAAGEKDVQLEYVKLLNGTAQAYAARGKLSYEFCTLAAYFANTPVGQELNRINPGAMTMPGNVAAPQKTAATGRQKELSGLMDIYSRLAGDTRSASKSFQAISENLGDLLTMDDQFPEKIPDANIGAYHQILTRAADAVNLYVSSHKTNPVTDKGKERIQLARELQTSLAQRQAALAARISELEQARQPENIAENQVATLEQANRLAEIAKVQRHIMPVRIVPKNPEFQAEPSRLSKVLHSFGHALVSGLSKYSHILYRGGVEIASKIFQKVREKTAPRQDLNTELIPGTDGNTFQNDYSEAELKDKIIDDIRRVPLIWEKAIPEDPDQAPTVSFNFSQYVEGDDRFKFGSEGGHGSITLKYSRIDPLTGKNTRYGITMGYFPSGGFDSLNIAFAEYFNGLRIPGQVMDDSNKVYDVSKTVTVDNMAINRILLAAQDFEKGGFNIVQRNCTSFVAEMAKAGGIDVSNVIREVDFKGKGISGAGIGLGSALLALGGPLNSLLAKRDVLNKAGKTNLDYKNFGQKMVNSQNVEQLWQAKDNIRLRGYNPAHAGETIRHEKGYRLNTTAYMGNYDEIRKQPESKGKREIQIRLSALRQEMGSFAAYLKQYVTKNGKAADREQNLAAVSSVEKYCKTMFTAMNGHVENLAAMNKAPSNAENLKKACVAINGVMDEFIDGLTEIYHGTFHSDEKLNIPFSHLASLAYQVKDANAASFQTYSNMSVINVNRGNRAMVSAFLNSTKSYKCKVPGANGNQMDFSFRMDAPHLVGMLRAFGSFEEGMKHAYLKQQLKEKAGTKTTRLIETAEQFAKAEKYFFTGKKLSEKDYQLAFSELPRLAAAQNMEDQTNPADIYQSEIFNRIFSTVCPQIREKAKILSNPKYSIPKSADYIHKAINKALSDDLAKPEAAEAMKQVKTALLPEVIARFKSEHKALDPAKINQALNDKIYDRIADCFMVPMLNNIAGGTGNKEIWQTEDRGEAFYDTASQYINSKEMNPFKEKLEGVSVAEKISEAISKEQPGVEVANGAV